MDDAQVQPHKIVAEFEEIFGDLTATEVHWLAKKIEAAIQMVCDDHIALQKALVGDTGLSAILEATKLRALHPLTPNS